MQLQAKPLPYLNRSLIVVPLLCLCAGCDTRPNPSAEPTTSTRHETLRPEGTSDSDPIDPPELPSNFSAEASEESIESQAEAPPEALPVDISRCESGRVHLQNGLAAKVTGDLGTFQVELDEAVEDFTLAIGFNPRNADAYYHRGEVFYRRGLLRSSIEDLKRATRLRDDFFDAYFLLGRVFYAKEDYICADAFTQRAIDLRPLSADAHAIRAQACSARGYALSAVGSSGEGHFNEAIDEYREAIRLEPAMEVEIAPQLAHALRGLTREHTKNSEWQEALECVRQAFALEPDTADNYVVRAEYYHATGSPQAALADYESAIEIAPNLAERLQPTLDDLHKKLGDEQDGTSMNVEPDPPPSVYLDQARN